MKIEEPWPQKTLELPIPKPQEPIPPDFFRWIESRLTTKRYPRAQRDDKRRPSKKN